MIGEKGQNSDYQNLSVFLFHPFLSGIKLELDSGLSPKITSVFMRKSSSYSESGYIAAIFR